MQCVHLQLPVPHTHAACSWCCVCVVCVLAAVNVYLPKDRVTNNHQGYGFVEYRAEEDADYVSTTRCSVQQQAGREGGGTCGG